MAELLANQAKTFDAKGKALQALAKTLAQGEQER
jgi:hypothetical protein